MAQSAATRHSLSFVAETTFGTTPGTPAMKEFRHTNCSLAVRKNTFQSEEIRSDRMLKDMRHGVRRGEGDIDFELSYGAFDAFLEAALFGSWSSDVLKAATTERFFTIERAYEDISEYHPFVGCMVNSFMLDVKPEGMVTGKFGIVGTGLMTPASSPLDASITAASTHAPFDGFTGSIDEGGSANNSITAFKLELQNNLTPVYVIGSNTAPHFNEGKSIATGEVTAFLKLRRC